MANKKLPIECGKGWLALITECHERLYAIDKEYDILQIKEKFGGLRYYFHSNHRDKNIMQAIVDEYERRSLETCEICGQPGSAGKMNTGWRKTLCQNHWGEELSE